MHPQSTPSRQQFVRLCDCGCGQPTLLTRRTSTVHGDVRGVPRRFLRGHQSRGIHSARWKGGRYRTKDGYVFVKCPNHPHADKRGYVEEHRLVVEARLGRYLSASEIVHHEDENPANNSSDNLVLTTRPEHPRFHAGRRWSRQHPRCVDCGTTERKHEAHGRCQRCFQHWRYANDPTWRARFLAAMRRRRSPR